MNINNCDPYSENLKRITQIEASLKFNIQIESAELIGQEDKAKIERISKEALDQLELCKETIKEVKSLQLYTIDDSKEQKLAQVLFSLKDRKHEILELKKNADDRLLIIQRRQALYGQNTIPLLPNFTATLRELAFAHPEFKAECEHFKKIIESSMGLTPYRFVLEDIHKLRLFADHLEEESIDSRLCQAVIHQCTAMKAAWDRKDDLLADLGSWMELEGVQNTPFDEWSPEQKLFFLTRADQILNNPFEAKFERSRFLEAIQNKNEDSSIISALCVLLKHLWEEDTRTSKKTDYWNHAPPFEQRCHSLADTPELKKYLFACKLDGLKKIIGLRPKNDAQEHLIVGAGPSGLIGALSKEMQGLPYKIIEKRSEEKVPRENTITFGKENPKDMEILFFLGVIAEFVLEDNVSLGHNKAHLMEVKIGDLENGLLHVLEELHGMNPVDYSTEVSEIELSEQGEARVILMNRVDGETLVHLPKTVTIADGFSGKTKDLLGVSRIDLAKPTMIAFSIFKDRSEEEDNSTSKTLKYRISNALRGASFMLAVSTYKLLKNKTLEESFAKVIKRGPSAIFRIPDQDYLVRVLRKKEQDILADYRTQIKKLDRKLASLELKPATARNMHKREKMINERSEIHGVINSRLQRHAEEMHGMLDFIQEVHNSAGHQMKRAPMKSTSDFLVDVQIGKAERNIVVVGSTPFLIRGDASHSTDPYAGYGCKTALEEIQADQNFYNTSMSDVTNPVSLSMLEMGHEYYQQRMINFGLQRRRDYRKRTETLARYTDRAVTNRTISQTEAGQFLRLITQNSLEEGKLLKGGAEADLAFSFNLQKKLLTELDESLHIRASGMGKKQKLVDNLGVKLSRQEKQLFKKALRQAFEDPSSIDSKEFKKLETLCAKLTFNDVPEGWMLAMIYQNANLLSDRSQILAG